MRIERPRARRYLFVATIELEVAEIARNTMAKVSLPNHSHGQNAEEREQCEECQAFLAEYVATFLAELEAQLWNVRKSPVLNLLTNRAFLANLPIFAQHCWASGSTTRRCNIGVPSRGYSHARNPFQGPSHWLSLLRRQTILPVEKKRPQRLVPLPCAVSKPVSLRGLRCAVLSQ